MINGSARSSLTTTEPLPVLPTRSVAEEVRGWPAVSSVWLALAGAGPLATPAPVSVADQLTETGAVLFQPAAFEAGETAPVTAGLVLSSAYGASVLAVCPLQFLLSKAATWTVLAPSPDPAVNWNDHVAWPFWLVCWPECAPLTWTHEVLLDVLTVSVRVAPFLA